MGQLERTLTLLENGEIDILLVTEEKETTGSKRKRKWSKTSVWKVEQPNGPPASFSVASWGKATREYMSALRGVPPDAMARIISEAKSVAMMQKSKTVKASVPSEEMCTERATLAFR